MKRGAKSLGAGLVVLAICAHLTGDARASEREILEKKFSSNDRLLGQCHMWQDVVVFCRAAKLLCGLEGSGILDRPKVFEGLALGETTVGSALNAFMARHSSFRWYIKDDVLIFAPKDLGGATRNSHDPLKLRVSSFSVTNKGTFQSVTKLCEPFGKVAGYMSPGNPAFQYGGSKDISINLKDVSLLDALNRIVKADGAAIWEINEAGENLFCETFPWDPGLPFRKLPGRQSKESNGS